MGAALMASACTDSNDDPPVTTAGPVTTAPPTTSAAVDGTAAASEYFAALASRDPAQTERMLAVSAPGSTAYDYAQHQAAVRAVLGAESAGFVESDDTGALVCSGAPEPEQDVSCSRFASFAFDDEGRLTGFTIDGEGLAGRLSVDGAPTVVDRITVRQASAYRSPATGSLFVVLDVTNDSAQGFELFQLAAAYRPADDEPALEAEGAWGDATLDPGNGGRVVVRFTDAELGGVIQVSGWSDASVGVSFVVDVAPSVP